jgi:hypothetical protein
LYNTEAFISAFSRLGQFLRLFTNGAEPEQDVLSGELEKLKREHSGDFSGILDQEPVLNPWFTRDFLSEALKGITSMLEEQVLREWLGAYEPKSLIPDRERTVGLVLAGNIPLVGFHDLMTVLASGHKVLAKPSTKDDRLIRKIAEILAVIDPDLETRIRFTDDKLSGMDAVIATGSDNSARYFEYYFRKIPHIIRKNRNGVAVLSGQENEEELQGLGADIFTYFGMGCRNVTKLYIPESYDLKILLGVLDQFLPLYQHHKYGNNVDYYRSIYLMNRVPILDNGVLLLKEDSAIASPVGVVFYERYSDIEWVVRELEQHSQEIQCVVSTNAEIKGAILPGTTQRPMPWDYADGVDTIKFLTELA